MACKPDKAEKWVRIKREHAGRLCEFSFPGGVGSFRIPHTFVDKVVRVYDDCNDTCIVSNMGVHSGNFVASRIIMCAVYVLMQTFAEDLSDEFYTDHAFYNPVYVRFNRYSTQAGKQDPVVDRRHSRTPTTQYEFGYCVNHFKDQGFVKDVSGTLAECPLPCPMPYSSSHDTNWIDHLYTAQRTLKNARTKDELLQGYRSTPDRFTREGRVRENLGGVT